MYSHHEMAAMSSCLWSRRCVRVGYLAQCRRKESCLCSHILNASSLRCLRDAHVRVCKYSALLRRANRRQQNQTAACAGGHCEHLPTDCYWSVDAGHSVGKCVSSTTFERSNHRYNMLHCEHLQKLTPTASTTNLAVTHGTSTRAAMTTHLHTT